VLLVLLNEHADNRQHVIMVARMFAMFACPHPNMFVVALVVVALEVAKCRCCLMSMTGTVAVQ
jgi:hypothetical protein